LSEKFAVYSIMSTSRIPAKFKTPPKRNYFDVFLEIPFDGSAICNFPQIISAGAEMHEVGILLEMYYLTYLDDATLDILQWRTKQMPL